jgi:hypothetical protein
MNDSKNSSNGLLVLRYPIALTQEQSDNLAEAIRPTAEALGVEAIVLGNGADARLEYGASALLERVCVALEALVAQGQPPELSEPQIAPQALNARQPSEKEIVAALSKSYAQIPGLNQRPPRRNPGPDHG